MERNMIRRHRLWYGVAAFVLVMGCLAAAILIISTLTSYPSLIKEAYKSPLQKVEVPGEADIDLRRKGAYGVYYESANAPTEGPPVLHCRLISKTTGDDIPLVPDYVPTNRYLTKDGKRVGVLIYSTTINEPSLHTLACEYPDGRMSPKLMLAIGPNYFFELLRVVWNLGGSLLGGVGVLCGSFVFSLCVALVALVRGSQSKQLAGKAHE